MKKNEKKSKDSSILLDIENKIKKYLKKHIDGEKLEKITNNYILIVTILFIISNIIFRHFTISGILYHVIMIILLVANVRIIYINKDKIRYKRLAIFIYFFIWIISKNFYGVILILSTLITLISIEFGKYMFVKLLGFVFAMFVSIIFVPFLYLQIVASSLFSYDDDAFEDAHYYCNNHYEAYVNSAGAFDSYHRYIGKHYDFLDLGVIISISYNGGHEVSAEEYNKYIETHNCKWNGGINGFK